jgi:hypothetical protein
VFSIQSSGGTDLAEQGLLVLSMVPRYWKVDCKLESSFLASQQIYFNFVPMWERKDLIKEEICKARRKLRGSSGLLLARLVACGVRGNLHVEPSWWHIQCNRRHWLSAAIPSALPKVFHVSLILSMILLELYLFYSHPSTVSIVPFPVVEGGT